MRRGMPEWAAGVTWIELLKRRCAGTGCGAIIVAVFSKSVAIKDAPEMWGGASSFFMRETRLGMQYLVACKSCGLALIIPL